MGQLASLMQQAIRASDVGCQPAHTATFPAKRATTATSAARRRVKITMYLECEMHEAMSNITLLAVANAMQGECQIEYAGKPREPV